MSTKLRILSPVYDDLNNIFLYYENESPGLGFRFLENVDSAYENIQDFPLMYQVKFDDVHQAPMTKFPYAVFYTVEVDEIIIITVRSTKQDPATFPRRI